MASYFPVSYNVKSDSGRRRFVAILKNMKNLQCLNLTYESDWRDFLNSRKTNYQNNPPSFPFLRGKFLPNIYFAALGTSNAIV